MSGYPRFEGDRYLRDPYEERMMRNLERTNDPYAGGHRNNPFIHDRPSSHHQGHRPSPPPIFIINPSREEQRRSLTLDDRRSPFASFLRISESPRPRPSTRRVSRFGEVFGNLLAPAGESRRERLQYDPSGPPRDPFTSHSAARDRPYGGGPPPRNPFVPGGDLYDYEREVGRRHPSIEPNLSRFDDQQRRRHNHYRSRVGEPWGIADFQNYQGRRRHEERVHRPSRRDEERGLLDI